MSIERTLLMDSAVPQIVRIEAQMRTFVPQTHGHGLQFLELNSLPLTETAINQQDLLRGATSRSTQNVNRPSTSPSYFLTWQRFQNLYKLHTYKYHTCNHIRLPVIPVSNHTATQLSSPRFLLPNS
ncbi:hypothetical protein ACTXT7_003037 [Hymenolepis weldensis]